MNHRGYYNRALKANDPRFARVFGKLGYGRSDMVNDSGAAEADDAEAQLDALRDEYQVTLGKKPYHGWDAATLRAKIAAGQQPA